MADATRPTTASHPVSAILAVPAAVTKELLAFGVRRMKANSERWERIWATRTPGDYIDAQMKFAADAMADYADEASRLQAAVRSALDGPR